MLSIHDVRCDCRGERYFGTYEVQGGDDGEIVRVWYEGDITASPTCGLPASLVARTLLGELVTKRLNVAATVTPPIRLPSQTCPTARP